jgi:PKD repeat protein
MQQIREKNIFTRWRYLILLNFLFLFIVTSGYARDVTLQWDPNSEPDLAGYRLFYCEEGQSYDYFNPSWEGTNTTCTIYDLEENKTYYCVVRAFDTEGLESGNSNEVCIETTVDDNQQPIAYIGLDPTSGIAPLTVNFDGSGSYDPDGEIVSYHWDLGDGTPPTWGETVSHTFKDPEVYTITLTVTDNNDLTARDQITITVDEGGSVSPNQAPVVDAGSDDLIILPIDTVTLEGTVTDDGLPSGVLTTVWNQISGPANQVVFDNAYAIQTTARFLTAGIYVLQLTADDGELTASDQITITVNEAESRIEIEAEDMPVKTTGGPTSEGWNIWSNGYIADTVNFPTGGTYTFEVRAKGSYAGGAWPIMEVRIDQNEVGTVTVDASSWAVYTIQAYVSSGTHEVAIAFTNDYYRPPQDRNLYVDKLTITDAGDNHSPNAPPEASILLDCISGIAPVTVNFDGSGSYDPDGDIVSYHWDFGDGFTDMGETVSHTFIDSGAFTVTLTVTDNQGSTGSDTIEISAASGFTNQSPVAVVSSDSTGGVAAVTVNFDGSGSYDPDGDIVSYHWDFGDGFTDMGETVSHIFSDPGVYTVMLTVTDNQDSTGSDTIEISVASGSGLVIEAEDMPVKTTGGPTSEGWNIWSNGYIADTVDFSTGGTYTFEVRAKGSYAGRSWPIMEVRIDGDVIGTVTVKRSSWAVYTIQAYASSGTHEVAIAFTNDYYRRHQDRNLYVDNVTIYP